MPSARDLVIGPALDVQVERTGESAAVRAGLDRHLRALAAAWSHAHVPSPAEPLGRWRLLAGLGRTDLALARLAEGHLDALGILAEAGRRPRPNAVYGVWASASGGTGLRSRHTASGWQLDGTLRFCSGARTLDRALVTARDGAGATSASPQPRLLDVDLRQPAIKPIPGTWPAVGMDLSDSLDVEVRAAVVDDGDVVGGPGFYVERTGLHLGGLGVAAVWLGGAQALMDRALEQMRQREPDEHQLAHIGAVAAALEGAAAVLLHIADELAGTESDPGNGLPLIAWDDLAALALLGRSSVEAAVGVALDRLARVVGPVVLCRDSAFTHGLADLTVYVRQHHAERDLARLGQVEVRR